jgi:outer membrane protein assembly factor BamB
VYDLKSGQFVWEDEVDAGPFDEFLAVAASGNRVFVVGYGGEECVFGWPSYCDMLVRAYDTNTGQLVWADRLDKPGTEEIGWGIAVQGGRVFATGTLYDSSTASDLLIRAYAAGGDHTENNNDE